MNRNAIAAALGIALNDGGSSKEGGAGMTKQSIDLMVKGKLLGLKEEFDADGYTHDEQGFGVAYATEQLKIEEATNHLKNIKEALAQEEAQLAMDKQVFENKVNTHLDEVGVSRPVMLDIAKRFNIVIDEINSTVAQMKSSQGEGDGCFNNNVTHKSDARASGVERR